MTLALGVGLSTALVSVIDATMLRPLPYPDPEQLVRISVEEQDPSGEWEQPAPSMEDMRAWQQATDVVSLVAGHGSAFRGRIVDGPAPERVRVLHFTEDYLAMHGVTPQSGRGFTGEDTAPGAPLVALLGYGYWQSRFGGRRDILGETIRLDDEIATIVGILPAAFNASTPLATPLRIDTKEFSRRGTGRVSVYARLRPGVTLEQARAQLSARTPQKVSRTGGTLHARAVVSSRLEAALLQYRTTINVLGGAVALILLLACVNVAGLLLARGAARRRELAVRASLGAGRSRLVRQLLTESITLSVPAALLGVLLAWLALDTFVANVPLALPANSPVTLNLTVLALTGALLVPTTLLFGLVPALRLSRVRLGSVLAAGSRQGGSTLSHRGGQLLIAAEVALAVVLVTGAALMIRSFARISAVDLGFNPEGLITMRVLPLERTPEAHKHYYTQLLPRLRLVQGVTSVGLVDNFALAGSTTFTGVVVDGKRHGTTMFEVMPGYFETIGVAVRDGRLPSGAEYAAGFRAVVLNESAARTLFPNGSAVGRPLIRAGQAERPGTVVGVIADLRHGGPLEAPTDEHERRQTFFPLEPTARDMNSAMTVVIRTSGHAPGIADELRRAAQSIGPRVLVERIQTADAMFGERVITPRRRTVLLGLLGALGLTLALVGVFGMTSYAVTRRTAEIGVRMALGARPAQVVGRIVGDAAIPIALGIAVGLVGALLATRAIQSFLFETAPNDALTLTAVAVLLGASGAVAALVPARRAAAVDPASSLRAE